MDLCTAHRNCVESEIPQERRGSRRLRDVRRPRRVLYRAFRQRWPWHKRAVQRHHPATLHRSHCRHLQYALRNGMPYRRTVWYDHSSAASKQPERSGEPYLQSVAVERLRRTSYSNMHTHRLRKLRLPVRWLRSQEQAAIFGELELRSAVATEE